MMVYLQPRVEADIMEITQNRIELGNGMIFIENVSNIVWNDGCNVDEDDL